MEFENTALYQEVQSVIGSGAKPVHFSWQATIHVNGTQTDIPAVKVVSVDKRADYETSYTDLVVLRVAMTGGVYANQVYPYRGDLEVTLTQYPIGEASVTPDNTGQVQGVRYQASLRDTGDPMLKGQSINLNSQDAMDLTNFLEIEFQLLEKTVEQLRMLSVGGVTRDCTVGDFLRTTLTTYGQSTSVSADSQLLGVDMADPSNQTQRDHIVIPHGRVGLLDLPDYVQQKCGGVYSTGLGSYIRDRHWYLYPLLDYSKFDQADQTATILVVPPKKYSGIERTYRQDPGNLVLIASGEFNFKSDSDAQQLNHGNGVRYADASKLMESYVTTTGNKTLAARGAVNSEYVSTARANGLNNVKTAGNAITANPYEVASQLARRNGALVSVLWENSNDSLLTPSMLVQVLYLVNGQVKALKGVIVKTQTNVAMTGVGLTDGRYTCNTGIACFVQLPTQTSS